ncbi:hypothetical protein L2E82_22760 [Cichorium intybus]|uniref:Uncharacterized protein n=1 Tax=Cichorium intybus TaxID=13427 RepID=A0ACB9DYF9_CICIN|nr:hypothetical protein L2E82_22760 [Cichorium intybus]
MCSPEYRSVDYNHRGSLETRKYCACGAIGNGRRSEAVTTVATEGRHRRRVAIEAVGSGGGRTDSSNRLLWSRRERRKCGGERTPVIYIVGNRHDRRGRWSSRRYVKVKKETLIGLYIFFRKMGQPILNY